MRQRLLIGLALVVGGLCWWLVTDPLRPADGSEGLTLFSARIGALPAIALAAAAAVPVAALGVLASATGHPLAGVFAVAGSLVVLAARGGSSRGWLWRADLPGDLSLLILEVALWQAGWCAILMVIQKLRSPLHTRWPALAFSDHLGVDTRIAWPGTQSLLAGLVCALVGGGLAHFLLRSAQPNQIVWGLIVAFTLGAMTAQLIFPAPNPIGILLAPAVVAVVAYAYVRWTLPSSDALLAAWYNAAGGAGAARLPGLAMALPIHYASAGVAGCAMGVGLAQSFDAARTNVATA